MKKKPEKVLQRFREELDGGLCISSITLAELEYGMKHSSNPAKNEQAVNFQQKIRAGSTQPPGNVLSYMS